MPWIGRENSIDLDLPSPFQFHPPLFHCLHKFWIETETYKASNTRIGNKTRHSHIPQGETNSHRLHQFAGKNSANLRYLQNNIPICFVHRYYIDNKD